jgi:hypothetical protein
MSFRFVRVEKAQNGGKLVTGGEGTERREGTEFNACVLEGSSPAWREHEDCSIEQAQVE